MRRSSVFCLCVWYKTTHTDYSISLNAHFSVSQPSSPSCWTTSPQNSGSASPPTLKVISSGLSPVCSATPTGLLENHWTTADHTTIRPGYQTDPPISVCSNFFIIIVLIFPIIPQGNCVVMIHGNPTKNTGMWASRACEMENHGFICQRSQGVISEREKKDLHVVNKGFFYTDMLLYFLVVKLFLFPKMSKFFSTCLCKLSFYFSVWWNIIMEAHYHESVIWKWGNLTLLRIFWGPYKVKICRKKSELWDWKFKFWD